MAAGGGGTIGGGVSDKVYGVDGKELSVEDVDGIEMQVRSEDGESVGEEGNLEARRREGGGEVVREMELKEEMELLHNATLEKLVFDRMLWHSSRSVVAVVHHAALPRITLALKCFFGRGYEDRFHNATHVCNGIAEKHPNLLKPYTTFLSSHPFPPFLPQSYIRMGFVLSPLVGDGESVKNRLEREKGGVEWEEALGWVEGFIAAVQHLHKSQFVIESPQLHNLLLTSSTTPSSIVLSGTGAIITSESLFSKARDPIPTIAPFFSSLLHSIAPPSTSPRFKSQISSLLQATSNHTSFPSPRSVANLLLLLRRLTELTKTHHWERRKKEDDLDDGGGGGGDEREEVWGALREFDLHRAFSQLRRIAPPQPTLPSSPVLPGKADMEVILWLVGEAWDGEQSTEALGLLRGLLEGRGGGEGLLGDVKFLRESLVEFGAVEVLVCLMRQHPQRIREGCRWLQGLAGADPKVWLRVVGSGVLGLIVHARKTGERMVWEELEMLGTLLRYVGQRKEVEAWIRQEGAKWVVTQMRGASEEVLEKGARCIAWMAQHGSSRSVMDARAVGVLLRSTGVEGKKWCDRAIASLQPGRVRASVTYTQQEKIIKVALRVWRREKETTCWYHSAINLLKGLLLSYSPPVLLSIFSVEGGFDLLRATLSSTSEPQTLSAVFSLLTALSSLRVHPQVWASVVSEAAEALERRRRNVGGGGTSDDVTMVARFVTALARASEGRGGGVRGGEREVLLQLVRLLDKGASGEGLDDAMVHACASWPQDMVRLDVVRVLVRGGWSEESTSREREWRLQALRELLQRSTDARAQAVEVDLADAAVAVLSNKEKGRAHAVGVLRFLALNDTGCRRIGDANGVQYIIQTIESHMLEDHAETDAFQALGNLVWWSPQNRSQLRQHRGHMLLAHKQPQTLQITTLRFWLTITPCIN